jgi:hypothetical protein
MVRVGFAVGSWQVISLAAALDEAADRPGGEPCEDHLVLYETAEIGAALASAMREVAASVRPWRRVIEAFDLFRGVPRKPDQRRLDALIARVRERLGLDRIDELWLCWVTRPAEKLIMEAYPDARVMLYEDGLTSYLPMACPLRDADLGDAIVAIAPKPVRRWLDAKRPARRFRRHRSRLDPAHLRRIDGAWMLLADCWPAPPPLRGVPRHAVTRTTVADKLSACRSIASVAAFEAAVPDRPAVLLLGQTLSRWGALPRDDELAIYDRAMGLALDRGYDVWWKEHPRAREPFYPELAARHPGGRVRRLELPFALPVELVADRLRLAACISGISAALYYLARLCGIDGYTFADELAPHVDGPWAEQNRMVVATLPPMRDLPPAAPRPSA